MNSRAFSILAALLALIASIAIARSQGFSGLGMDAAGFATVQRGRTLAFPADFGPHPDYRIEWWYLTANLKDKAGNEYGVQWTLFRQATAPGGQDEGWSSRQLWMGHAAVTSATTHRFAEKFARGGVGQAGVTTQPFAAFIDDWQMKADKPETPRLSPLELTASGQDFSYGLKLEADGPLVLQGEAGYSVKSERGQASYYYSQPFLTVSGEIVLDGRSIDVTGKAWIDREWSSQPLASDQTGWDWFSLHLSSGDKVMLFRLRHADGRHFFAGNWIGKDGRSEVLPADGIMMTPGDVTRVGEKDIPTTWHVTIPSKGIDLRSAPLNPRSWMGTMFSYWEGPVRVTGSHDGIGYLEMTGY